MVQPLFRVVTKRYLLVDYLTKRIIIIFYYNILYYFITYYIMIEYDYNSFVKYYQKLQTYYKEIYLNIQIIDDIITNCRYERYKKKNDETYVDGTRRNMRNGKRHEGQ